jgi:hypothetical protein
LYSNPTVKQAVNQLAKSKKEEGEEKEKLDSELTCQNSNLVMQIIVYVCVSDMMLSHFLMDLYLENVDFRINERVQANVNKQVFPRFFFVNK